MSKFRKIKSIGFISLATLTLSSAINADNLLSSSSTASQSTSHSTSASSVGTQASSSTASSSTKSSSIPASSTTIDTTTTKQVVAGNYPMGYFADASNTPTSKVSSKSISLSSSTPAPDNLYSNNTSLPSRDVVDVASYESWMTQADYNNLKNQGVKTVVVKLTEGTSYTNPYAAKEIQYAKAAGLNVAVYHFADLGNAQNQATANSQAVAEAQYFVSVAKSIGISSNTAMILDCESPYVNSAVVDWTAASLTWASTMKTLGYSNVKYYTSESWTTIGGNNIMEEAKLGAKNMWVAQYLYGTPSSSNLKNTQFGAWQYSSQMYFTGASKNSPVDITIDYANMFIATATTTTPDTTKIITYRLYNSKTGEHLYTQGITERNYLISNGWNDEGIGWYAPANGQPVYRLFNRTTGEHLYTTGISEKNYLVTTDWNYEGIAWYSGGSYPIYRAYNGRNDPRGSHNWTSSLLEQNYITSHEGWNDEGIAWYAVAK
ncbi:MAG: family 25 glycosyl hydrolase [Streptococcaceae bacterium]|jgi:GH25 family lysozyme M1 (1,4-beta-N-acetylmuramidase)|nr:family 25 glycosyl hydrolase [Streptococcaceae bacterium]